MIDSPGIAAFVAVWGFWVLLCVGWMRHELRARGTGVFIALWLTGFLALRRVLLGLLFAPYVAVLDIALVFVIFHGDIRLT